MMLTNSKPKGWQSKIAQCINAYSHRHAAAVQMAQLAKTAQNNATGIAFLHCAIDMHCGHQHQPM